MSDQKTIMRDMVANAVHFGHKCSKWNPKMAPYLYGQKNGVHLFDLNHTYKGLMAAEEFLKNVAAQGKQILFVSTKKQAQAFIRAEAEKCGMPFVTSKWIPGLLTNFKTIRERVKYMQKLKDEEENGEFVKYTKKEAMQLKKQIAKLEMALGGVANLDRRPDVLFVVDAARDKLAVTEANKMKITVVAIADSNVDPDGIQFPVPGNDDAPKSIHFLMNRLSAAIQEGARKK